MSPELKDLSGFYASRVSSKDSEIKRLRAYICELESAGKKLSAEYAGQLRTKNAEIERLSKVLENERAAKKVKLADSGVLLKNGKTAGKEIEMLRGHILELENSGKMLGAEYAEQISEKDRQVRRLVNMLKLGEESNRLLSEKIDGKARAERDYVERLKGAISRKEEFNREIIERLTEGLSRKNEEVDRLRDAAVRQEKLVKRFESEVAEYRNRQESLEAFLREKDSMIGKIDKNFAQQLRNKEYEIERLGSELRKQFDSKPAARGQEEIASLRIKLGAKEGELNGLAQEFANIKEQNRIAMKRLDERQKLFVESEKTYNGLINSLQLQQEKRVKELMSANSKREVELKTEIEKLKSERREKETLLAEKESRIDETLLQFSETSKRLLELKGGDGAADDGAKIIDLKGKEAEIAGLLKEADERIKAAMIKEHEIARREELLIKEQEAINSELSILSNAGVEIQKDREYLKEKIRKYEIPEKETQVGQPALFGEENITADYAGEIQPENAEVAEAEPVQEAVEEVRGKSEALEILRRPGKSEASEEEPMQPLPFELKAKAKKGIKKIVFKPARSRVKPLPRPPVRSIKAKADRPKIREALMRQAEQKEAFPEVGGYGEIHEIESIISIGLQHGDSVDQIKRSLEDSGYSKQTIEKAFRQAKKN